ncbi:hypothetical protein BDM02DRAFT_3121567 [Thelephora ganbajun]|uniref:Uncharacterized protein n=1 Tax=Thelephora ganbajun TaxID=370292 RepID=A0ACB6Z519_THEGA|nr:hypothetical protein BDM02DRAFT_3121567 [Thelephora ganbajun]
MVPRAPSLHSRLFPRLSVTTPRDFEGLCPYPAHYTLPAPSPGPFVHPKPSINNIPTIIPSPGPDAPSSPPSTTSPVPPRETIAKDICGLVSYAHGPSSTPHASCFAFEHPFSSQLDVSYHSVQFRGRQCEDGLFGRIQHHADIW